MVVALSKTLSAKPVSGVMEFLHPNFVICSLRIKTVMSDFKFSIEEDFMELFYGVLWSWIYAEIKDLHCVLLCSIYFSVRDSFLSLTGNIWQFYQKYPENMKSVT